LWARASGPATLDVEYALDAGFSHPRRGPSVRVTAETDFTGQLELRKLQPATRYHYRITARPDSGAPATAAGSFVTAPKTKDSRNVRFLWAGDLGGQALCRRPQLGYTIFDAMTALRPDFVFFAGDMIYADSPCTSPPNLPGSDFVAKTLEQFRQRWRYNREDPHHLRLLASTSMISQWDDHEVTNDFAGPSEPLMPLGRQAYFEFHPITRADSERYRLYRRFVWGHELELIVLDNRQYRDANAKPDGPGKTMLGARQLAWLLESLARSKARWKIVATSVPFSVPTGTDARTKGRDAWANGSTASRPEGEPTGWEREMMQIFEAIRARPVTNLVWITTDVHFAQFARLDPFGNGSLVCHELISGPLHAVTNRPSELDTTLHPERLFAEGPLYNFGAISIDAATHRLTAEIIGVPATAPPETEPSVRYKLVLDPVR
jgi:alkaline phosphatase D